uniref:(northern house mosquito) hypothetical protein n=1 Tax=Culex pipiens TaxID=7175 RepID=A0A8D8NXD9_CULPI
MTRNSYNQMIPIQTATFHVDFVHLPHRFHGSAMPKHHTGRVLHLQTALIERIPAGSAVYPEQFRTLQKLPQLADARRFLGMLLPASLPHARLGLRERVQQRSVRVSIGGLLQIDHVQIRSLGGGSLR